MCNCSSCGDITTLTLGPKGDKGDTGAAGPAGAQGATGPAGLATLPVIDGSTATVTLNGTTDTGSFILLDRPAGVVVGLPSAPAAGTNYTFQIAQNASGGSYVINVNGIGLDVFSGYVYLGKSATVPTLFTTTTGIQMTLNSDTTGGLVGGKFSLVFKSNKWNVSGTLYGSGTLATPFS